MNHKQVEEYILGMPNAKLDYPFGQNTAVYKVFVSNSSAPQLDGAQGSQEERTNRRNSTMSERATPADAVLRQKPASMPGFAGQQGKAMRGDWKMFALIAEKSDPLRLSLKCDPQLAELLRAKYETVMPGYHLNKKHWNTILLTGQLPWEEVQGLIRHSYNLVSETA